MFYLGVIDEYWWAIVFGLYVGGYLVVPRDETAQQWNAANFTEANLRERLNHLVATTKARLPKEAVQSLSAIREHADALLPKLDALAERGALAARTRFDILQSLTRYLPDVLATYLRLPPAYLRLVRDSQGQSPQSLLIEQLQVLEDHLGRAVQEAFEEDVTRLEVHGRFLKEKFSSAPL